MDNTPGTSNNNDTGFSKKLFWFIAAGIILTVVALQAGSIVGQLKAKKDPTPAVVPASSELTVTTTTTSTVGG